MADFEVQKKLSSDVIAEIREQIKAHDGNEVFFTGEIDSDGLVVSIFASAFGNDKSVSIHFENAKNASVIIHNHPNGNLSPSDADIGAASFFAERAKGFYIVNNDVSEIFVVAEAVKPVSIKKLDIEELSFYLSDGGPLSEKSETFEERPGQIKLLEHIGKTFNTDGLGVFEAGTGVGKSYAYLIPSIIWALQNKQRVVISTGTINLQQQLCEKDLPAAIKIVGKNVKFILMKGRQNYLCKRRFASASAQRELFGEDTEIYDNISKWLETTQSGSKSDLSFVPDESIWSRINSESDACLGMRCPHHSECFVMRARKEAASANIIVVNHHLFFADIEARMNGSGYDDLAVLPAYRHVIFDEAHGIENAATGFFSLTFNRFKLLKQLNMLYRKNKTIVSGYLCNIAMLSSQEEKFTSICDSISRIKTDLINLETAANDILQNNFTARLSDSTSRIFGPVITLANTLSQSLYSFTTLANEFIEAVSDKSPENSDYFESRFIIHRLEDFTTVLRDFSVWDEKREMVFWIQKRILHSDISGENGKNFLINFTETPLDIAPLMTRGVFEPMKSVVCTSATLKTGKDFRYWLSKTGLLFCEEERLITGDFPSPFPYLKNMLFAVPSDAPSPESINFQVWSENAVSSLILAADGRTLVLFTSYEALKFSYSYAVHSLKGFNGTLLKQGADDSARLLERFKKETQSVLFATDSFWQGVDIPGESLSQVIIAKLPFSVPNDPVFEARREAIEKRGGNPFTELSLPDAIIKFRQGLGRLMRRSSDRGAVVVLDNRIYQKTYGALFLKNIPECKKLYEPLEKICDKITDFLFS